MNTYRYVFAAKCPSDDETIIYGLEIRSREKIMVERIKEVCAEWPTGFQEEIAADLHSLLGGEITLRAQHQGVEIVTFLASPAAVPTSQPNATEFSELMAMPEEQIDAELRTLGIDPDDAARRAGDAIASAVEIAEQMRIAKKGATCPLCGRDFPHEHSPEEITIYRNGMKASAASRTKRTGGAP